MDLDALARIYSAAREERRSKLARLLREYQTERWRDEAIREVATAIYRAEHSSTCVPDSELAESVARQYQTDARFYATVRMFVEIIHDYVDAAREAARP
jgi:hypothetical protein